MCYDFKYDLRFFINRHYFYLLKKRSLICIVRIKPYCMVTMYPYYKMYLGIKYVCYPRCIYEGISIKSGDNVLNRLYSTWSQFIN